MFKKLLRRILLYVAQTKIYTFCLKHIVPYIRFTTYYPSFDGYRFRKGYGVLRRGDIILCADNRKLTTKLIGGELTHAAICIGKDDYTTDFFETLDMTHEDCRRAHFFDICKESDRVVILRCDDWDRDYITKVVEKALFFHRNDVKYDYGFTLGVKALYCSELIYQSDVEKRLQVNLEDVAGLGIPYISPTGLFNSPNCQIVYDSDEVSYGKS